MTHTSERTESASTPATGPIPGLMTLVINLDRAADRMAHMARELQAVGLPYTRIAAVDGTTLQRPHPDFSESHYRHLHGRHWAPKELGCYLSHIQCLRTFLASDAQYALILEDDVRLDPDIRPVLTEALTQTQHWNLLRLSTVNSGTWWPVRPLGRTNLAVCLTREKGAGGYVVDRVAARQMVDKLLPMRLAWDIAFDLEWLLGFKTLGVYPMVIQQNAGFGTDIQDDLDKIKVRSKLKYLTVAPFRLFLELSRLGYRLFRLTHLRVLSRA